MVKNIKNLTKLNDRSVLIIFFLFSIVQLIYIGFDLVEYLVYNVDGYYQGIYKQLYPDNITLKFMNTAKLIEFLVFYFHPFFQLPILFIISSILVKTFLAFFTYKISLHFVSEKTIALYITLFYLVSQYTHGVNLNGMWGSPIFFRSSISAFFTLLGIYTILTNRFFLSFFLFFSLSIQMHPAYGLTSLIYFFAGYFYYVFTCENKQKKNILIILLVIFANAFLLFYWSKNSLGVSPVEVSVSDWYHYLYYSNPDDVIMLWTFQKYGYVLFPLILFAFYVSVKNTQKSKIDYFYLGTFYVWVSFMIVELLHRNNIFFGMLSEYFITLEFRRGLWVLTFFATMIAFREMYKMFSLKNILTNNKLLFLLLLSLSIYIKPTVFNVILLAIFLTILVSNVYIKICSSITILYVLSLFITGKYIPVLSMNNTILYTVFTLLCSFGGLFIIRSRRQRNLNVVVILPLCFFLGTAFIYGIYKKAFFETYSILANKGLFRYPDHEKLIVDVYRHHSSEEFNIEMVQAIQRENKGHGVILMPMSEQTFSDLDLYKAPSYINSTMLPNFSKEIFCYMIYYLTEMGIVNYDNTTELIYDSKGRLDNLMDENYHKLTREKLLYLKEKHGVKIFVTMKEYNGLKLIYKDQKYFVYSL